MIINDRILARLMKDAFKKEGYTVARDGTKENSKLVLYAGNWTVEIDWKNIPGGILGLIAEHLKGLPNCGEAFQARKGECMTTIFDLVADVPPMVEELQEPINRTPLTYAGTQIWQRRNGNCVQISPEVADLLMDHGRQARFFDSGVVLHGQISKVYIKAQEQKPGSPEEHALAKLSESTWQ